MYNLVYVLFTLYWLTGEVLHSVQKLRLCPMSSSSSSSFLVSTRDATVQKLLDLPPPSSHKNTVNTHAQAKLERLCLHIHNIVSGRYYTGTPRMRLRLQSRISIYACVYSLCARIYDRKMLTLKNARTRDGGRKTRILVRIGWLRVRVCVLSLSCAPWRVNTVRGAAASRRV